MKNVHAIQHFDTYNVGIDEARDDELALVQADNLDIERGATWAA